jgi:ATP-binding cassette subfamily F protein uup
LEAVEKVANRVQLGNGKELSASQLCEKLGFNTDSQWTPVGDLSGGERRRLQLTRLLMDSPNVLVLDEPTNDFDVETLTALEDLLDSFGGTLLVISHDRYFLERVCNTFVGLLGDKSLRDLPGGIDQYLQLRHSSLNQRETGTNQKGSSSILEIKALKKEVARLERTLDKVTTKIRELEASQEALAYDHVKLAEVMKELTTALSEKSALEEEWLIATTTLEESGN